MHRGHPLAGRGSDDCIRSRTRQDGGELQIVGAIGSIEVPRVPIAEDVEQGIVVLRIDGLDGIVIGGEAELRLDVGVPASTRLRLRTSSDGITLDRAAVSKDSVDLSAGNGALTLPVAAVDNLKASCAKGPANVADLPVQPTGEQGTRRVRGRLNNCGTPFELATTNSDIHVRPRP